ncbi:MULTISPECIES: hypothetical protein [unclassified Rhodococcus (in: high G+C Gram-positive bacteria)]|uniref:hypothetical protein n=1 Tax=unclassified Rhodococcus (in: high G+C Gram-positive bacteria) TaxID=192944 RepID=UPI00339B9BA7
MAPKCSSLSTASWTCTTGTPGGEHVERLVPGTMCVAEVGDEHKAVPVGEARILVIEQAGSI